MKIGSRRPRRPRPRAPTTIDKPLPPRVLHGKQRLERPKKFSLPGGVAAFCIEPVDARLLVGNQRVRARKGFIELGYRPCHHAGNAKPADLVPDDSGVHSENSATALPRKAEHVPLDEHRRGSSAAPNR